MAKSARVKQPDATYLGPVNSWKALGIAIVRQAIVDWHESTLRLSKVGDASAKLLMENKRSAEHFLASPKVEFYSGLDGPTLLRKMKAGDI